MATRKFWGKHRGKVIDNIDPLERGRLRVEVPSMPGAMTNWALPCVAYVAPGADAPATPPIDTQVWIEFEQGDPNYPIWSGCYWEEGQQPLLKPPF